MAAASRISPLALGAALAAASLSLAACAPRYVWHMEGGGRAAVEQARAECKARARGYEFLEGPDRSIRVMTPRGDRYSEINVVSARREAGLFADCMREFGFSLVEIEEP